MLSSLPDGRLAEEVLQTVGGPIRPQEVGLGREMVVQSVLYAKEVRNRYTLPQKLWDMGLLEGYANRVADELFVLRRTDKYDNGAVALVS